jgi:hypothetical protein
LLVDDLYQLGVGDAWSGPVLAELQRRGIPFVVRNGGLVRQYGTGRRYDGSNARAALLISIGDAATATRRGARRVVLREGISRRAQRELAALERELGRHVRTTGLHLTSRGREALERGDFPELRRQLRTRIDPDALFRTRELRRLVDGDLLEIEPAWRARFGRYAELQLRWDRDTVALFVRPLAR